MRAAQKQYNSDVTWNILSFGLAGAIGVLLNILIVHFYSAATLGVFNQVYAIFIMLSQLAVGGIHLSNQKYIAQYGGRTSHENVVLTAAIFSCLITSIPVVGLSYLCRDLPAQFLGSEDVTVGFSSVLIGLLLFPLNKVMLAYHNGCRRMKAFAVFNSLRFISLLIFLLLFVMLGYPAAYSPVIFTLAEASIFVLLIIYSGRFVRLSFSKRSFKWTLIHLRFGLKAFLGNLLLDINTRVDVLILGVFASDVAVGVYSFASTIADGYNQVSSVFRSVSNPILTKAYFAKGKLVMERVVRRIKRSAIKVLVPIALLMIIAYPLGILLVGLEDEMGGSWLIFGTLVFGMMLSCPYLPLQTIFNQTGHPGWQTIFLFMFVSTNVVLNLVLIPSMGALGAAIATAVAYVAHAIYLKVLSKKVIAINV